VTAVLAIRHGLVENPRGLVYGRLPGFPLSAEGVAEAEEVAAAMASLPVRAVHASPLERAVQTAEILARPHGLPVVTDDRLLEWVSLAHWQGKPWADLTASAEYRELMVDPSRAGSPSPVDQAGRAVLAWGVESATAHADGVVLGVSHEAPLAAAYLLGRGQGFGSFRATHIPHLWGVRLEPGPPELVDPLQTPQAC
jgi:broad specificity phosphatase PhoE